MEKVNLTEKFTLFHDHWHPRIIGELNDSHVKIAKLKGEFVWHQHDEEDELFYIVKGELLLKLRDRDVLLKEGEFFIVPKGVEHKPVAEEEVHLMMIEPKTTVNTGNVKDGRTKEHLEQI